MKARPFKQDTTTAFPPLVSSPEVEEALAIHAARQKAKSPPKPMPVTPTLPRVPKPHRKRRNSGK
jgi:hypothetical protein